MAAANRRDERDLCALGIAQLACLYRSRELSPVDVVRAVLDRIDRLNPDLNAYITVLRESAISAANAAGLQFAAGINLGPLQGVPVSVKDIINVAGTRTTAGSRVLVDAPIDQEDAPVVRRLRAAGAVIVGKTNLHEFAFGDPDPEGPFGLVQNPRKIGHQAGSSSSGSAAAVAAGLGVLSLGTDTGGSVRHPASVCGVVGLKPTYGLLSLRGVIPLSTHLDHVGLLGRSVADVAAGLAAVAGHDPDDPYSVAVPSVDYSRELGGDVRGIKLGIPTNRIYQFGLREALDLVERAKDVLVDLGLAAVPVELPRAEETNDLNTTIIAVDLLLYHERYRGRENLYGRDFLKRAERGRQISGIQYARAMEAREEIRRLWLGVFKRVDLLLLPANVAGAPPHGQEMIEIDGEQHPVRMVTSRFSRAANLTGFPAIVVPVGETPEGLPIGVQLVAPPFAEARLLAVGHALERALGLRWPIEPRRG